MKLINIILFVPYLTGGGAQRVAINLLKGFDTKTNNYKLLVIKKTEAFIKDIPKEVEIVQLDSNRAITSILNYRNFIESYKPEVIISFLNYANIISYYSLLLSSINSKLIFTEHSNYDIKKKSKFKRLLFTHMIKHTYKKADYIITVSDGVKKSLVNNGLEENFYNFKTIYNPIVSEKLHELKLKSVDHRWINNSKYKVILGIGRLTEAKDFKTLIKAFNISLNMNKNLRLIILGEGHMKSELLQLIDSFNLNDYVDLPGFVDNPFAFLSKADLFVLSSKWEGFGNVIVEAMACGCPVISTDCNYGPNEIIEDEISGILTPVGDELTLSNNILRIINNNKLKKTLIKNGITKSKNFEINYIAKKYENLFLF